MYPPIVTETKKSNLKTTIIWLVASITLALILSIITVIVFPQKNLISSILVASLSSLWLACTFSFSNITIINRVEQFFIRKKVGFNLVIYGMLFVTYFVISVIGGTLTINTFGIFFLFYIIPISLLLCGQNFITEDFFH